MIALDLLQAAGIMSEVRRVTVDQHPGWMEDYPRRGWVFDVVNPNDHSVESERHQVVLWDDDPTSVDALGRKPGEPGYLADVKVDLTNVETALGLAAYLDMWERSAVDRDLSPNEWAASKAVLWVRKIELALRFGINSARYIEVIKPMVSRLERIAYDQIIRQALGEEPKPGTLAEVRIVNTLFWRLDSRKHGGVLIEWEAKTGKLLGGTFRQKLEDDLPAGYKSVPGLADADTMAEAYRAIYANYCVNGLV